jgi:hypothetical protein
MLDDLYRLREGARAALRAGDVDQAAHMLVAAAGQVHAPEPDYLSIVRPLAEVLLHRGDTRSALTVEWYIAGSTNEGFARALTLLPSVPPVDRARTLAAANDFVGAARDMEAAGLLGRAAMLLEKTGDYRAAGALWSRLSHEPAAHSDAYNAALVHFNIARCATHREDRQRAREATVTCVRLLEEAADHFESIGQRERAFDCFQVLVHLGREGGAFEDTLEGFVNSIRILREDHLKQFALQQYGQAIEAARQRKELSAAAILAREAAEYAQSIGVPALSAHYLLVQGKLWHDLAREHQARGAPPEICENALLAAILAFVDASDFEPIGALYTELSKLELEAARRRNYARAAKRYEGLVPRPLETATVPETQASNALAEVWHDDILEWEQHGSAAEACADILLNPEWPALIRRKAMLARLTAFAVEDRPNDASPPTTQARVRLAEELAQLNLYTVLSPLEKLFERPEREVKAAVLRAMQQLLFKRSFVTIRAGLRDSDPLVVKSAASACEALFFPHAFDPLARIVRESNEPTARAAAIHALSRIDTVEAAEFLLGIVDHGAPADRVAVSKALASARGTRFIELARAALPTSSPATETVLRNILRARNIAA